MNIADTLPGAAYRPRVDLIFFDAGGGHRASATALKAVAEHQGRGWEIKMLNLRDILEPIDPVHSVTGIRGEDLYNGMIKYGFTIGTGPMLRAIQFLIRRMHRRSVALLSRYFRERRPDLVVSMIPNFNRAIFEGLRTANGERKRPMTPMVTVMTDLADCPPHFWIERQDQYLICGTSHAAAQALAMGYSPERVLRTSGMIVRPEFYRPMDLSRQQERGRLGLRPDLPTGVVMFGGFGSRRMLTIARCVAQSDLKIQLILLCGRNQWLREELSSMQLPFPCYVEGFTCEIPYFMHLADFFVGKPGPGSISEALVMGLPVIVERNARTMIQERYNTEWIARNQFGTVLRSFNEIVSAIETILEPHWMARFRLRAATFNNRAVFEIPSMLEALLTSHRAESSRDPFKASA